MVYQLTVTTPKRRDWKTLWFLYSSEEYIITTNEDTQISDIIYMINEFEKFDCCVKVEEIENEYVSP